MLYWEGYKNYNRFYSFIQKDSFFDEIDRTLSLVNQDDIYRSKGKVIYYNIPASFDIETYSSYFNNRKFANMYIWQLGINGSVIYGRTWEEFMEIMTLVNQKFTLHYNKRLIIYVHNLGYEFQFIRKWLTWEKDKDGNEVVFSLKKRRPIYALSTLGIEFRCSYILSNYALVYIGSELLLKYPVTKKVGDLDYSIPRNAKTELTVDELGYCISDVQVVMSYIQEQIEQYNNNIALIPLTNTGRVRKFTHDYVFGEFETDPYLKRKKFLNYKQIMDALQITSRKEYDQLKAAFMGGFTHANALHVGEYRSKVGSGDIASCYPGEIVCNYFPMSRGKYIGQPKNDEEFKQYLSSYCCVFTIEFDEIIQTYDYESYISQSHCSDLSDDAIINNGRVAYASHLQTVITEVDFDIIRQVYSWDSITIHSIYIYERGYLPRDFILAVLELYGKKTSLKGIEDKLVEYMVSKNMLNSDFGMMVTNIIRTEALYNKDWLTKEPDQAKTLIDYNNSYNRFLFYAWGIYVTAHARHKLWEAIFEFGYDYVYADTDSIKGINFDRHMKFFEKRNKKQELMLSEVCLHYQIPWSKVAPRDKKGKEHPIGLWEIEESYRYFKTLGAKRYAYQHESGEINMTVAGVNKNTAIPWLLSKYCNVDYSLAKRAYDKDPRMKKEAKKAMKELVDQNINPLPLLQAFEIDLEIPPEGTGKNTLTYCDHESVSIITDLQGHTEICYEKSFIHMEPTSYYFSISKQFAEYLYEGIKTETF